MSIFNGPRLTVKGISIGAPIPALVKSSAFAEDVREVAPYWLDIAESNDQIVYFWVYQEQKPVGAFFLHDINDDTGESLIGYHLFEMQDRGKGIGTAALTLLVDYAQRFTLICQLIIITGKENVPSQRLAQKCGFRFEGGAWEDPENLYVYIHRLER